MATPAVDRDRLLAVVLLVLALFAVYLVGVHWWFTARHVAIWQEMSTLKDQEATFRATSAQRAEIEARLAEVRAFEASNPAFLPETDFDSAAAALSQRLRQIVTQHARNEQSCQIIMNQYAPSTERELFERAAIRIRLRCTLEEFQPILYDLESASPVLFIDELQIWKQTGFQQPGSNQVSSYLDIQFTLWGYLRKRLPQAGERGA
jgi:general secretion pathway protein M